MTFNIRIFIDDTIVGVKEMKHPGWFSVVLSLALMGAFVGFLYLIGTPQ